MSYTGPWRNRLRNLYTQYCYLDELAVCDPKLYRLLGAGQGGFDDDWHYGLSRRMRLTKRQVAWRRPLWLLTNESKFSERGDRKLS